MLKPDKAKPVVWSRPVSADVAPSPEPEKGVYGPPAPPYEDVKFQAPLAVAIDAAGERIAVADYEGWQRVFHPRDGSEDIPFGTRFMPSRPTIHVYDAEGNTLCRVGPEAFAEPFWCDLAFSADGRKLLISPHNWTSRGLGGQPFLPADADARTLYVLDIAQRRRPGRSISRCHLVGRHRWQGPNRRGLLGSQGVSARRESCRPIRRILGRKRAATVRRAASLVCVSKDGQRIAVATAAGVVRMLDADGKELWRDRPEQGRTARRQTLDEEPEARPDGPGHLADQRRAWPTATWAASILVEAPQGLILIDPNAGASFEQNWAKIQGAGLDPMQVKYVLLTHEHGDHAPGAYLWRVVTGAQVVASAEMAYILQHHIPGGTGYGFHPPRARGRRADRGQGPGPGRAEGPGHASARPHLRLDGLRRSRRTARPTWPPAT